MSNRQYPEYPRVGVGAFVVKDGSVLLVRRGRAPASGIWAIPGGNLHVGETIQQGAEREIWEETGVVIRAGAPVYTFESIERDEQGQVLFHYIVIDVIADYISGKPVAADDALEARWVSPLEIHELAVTKTTLKFLEQSGFL